MAALVGVLSEFLLAKYDPHLDKPTWDYNDGIVRGLQQRINRLWWAASIEAFDARKLTALVESRRRELNHAGKPVSAATVNRTVTDYLQRVFNHYEKTHGVTLPNKPKFAAFRLKEPRGRERVIESSRAEYALLNTSLLTADADYMNVVNFALLTGLRRANLLPKWDQIKALDVLKLTATMKIAIKSEGFNKEIVDVALSSAAVELIAAQWGKDPDYVFTYTASRDGVRGATGSHIPITVNGFRTWWQRHRKAVGVPDLRIHDLRRTTATSVLKETGDITLVQKLLGHRSIKTTMKYAYAQNDKLLAGLNSTAAANPWGHK